MPRILRFSRASAVSRISRSPERKTRMSPGPSDWSSSTASEIAVIWSRSPSSPSSSGERPVADLDGVRAARDLDDRGVAEVAREALRVDGRRGDDDLQVRASGQQLGEIAEQEVDVETALVRLVDDDRVVGEQLAVGLDLGEQDAVRHELDEGRLRVHLVREADLPADGLTQRGVQLVGDALGDRTGRDPARLGVPDHAAHAAAQLQTDLGDLRRLAGPGLTGDDHDTVVAYRLQDRVLLLADGKLLGITDRGHTGATPPDPVGGLLGLGGDLVQHGLPCLGLADAPGAFETAAEPLRVTQRDVGQQGLEVGKGSRHTGTRISPGAREWRTISARTRESPPPMISVGGFGPLRAEVAGAGIEPATYRFSGDRSYQLSYPATQSRDCSGPDGI